MAGLTNLQHNDIYGFLGYGGDSGSGYEDRKRTFENVDGDLFDNVTETDKGTNPYDINSPSNQEFPEMPASSIPGLVGLAGAAALNRKERRALAKKKK